MQTECKLRDFKCTLNCPSMTDKIRWPWTYGKKKCDGFIQELCLHVRLRWVHIYFLFYSENKSLVVNTSSIISSGLDNLGMRTSRLGILHFYSTLGCNGMSTHTQTKFLWCALVHITGYTQWYQFFVIYLPHPCMDTLKNIGKKRSKFNYLAPILLTKGCLKLTISYIRA